MAKQEFDNKKILSAEQQEHFDKYMREYEEQNGLLMDSYNEDTKLGKISKNKPVMLGLAGLLFVGCVAGIAMSFDKVDKQNSQGIKPPVVAQPTTPVGQPVQPSEQEISQEEKVAKEEAERDLNEIKKNFNPFEEKQQDGTPMNQSEIPVNPESMNNGHIPSNEVFIPEQPQQPPASVIPASSMPDDSINTEQAPEDVLSLKGTSVDRYGNKIAYIMVGEATGTYNVGDVVGKYHVANINKNNVVVEDDNGNRLYLNR